MASLKTRFRPAAVEELREAVEWYSKRNAKAADVFCRIVRDKLEEAAKNPQHWPKQRDGTRHILFKQYPYHLIVRDSDEVLEVFAVAHTSRRPGYWRKRLRE